MNIMLDIETLDTAQSAAIVQIAAVQFDDDNFNIIDSFSANVSVLDNLILGRTVSNATLGFWKEQEPTFEKESVSLRDALNSLARKLGSPSPEIWCKGPAFDIAILENAYAQLAIPIPWHYRKIRDLRTLLSICNVTVAPASHNAIEDCEAQIKTLSDCFVQISNGITSWSIDS